MNKRDRQSLIQTAFTYLLGGFFVFAGMMHFLRHEVYKPFVPDFLPYSFIVYSSGIIELLLGVGVVLKPMRKLAALGITLLMLVFLPLHIVDVFRENPAIGSKLLAYVRLPTQFVLILWPYLIWKNN